MKSLMGIPAIQKESDVIKGPFYRGGGNYVVTSADISMEEYENYKKSLEECGFEKYADNGEGFGNAVFSVTYQKGAIVLTVVYYAVTKNMTVSFYSGELSSHLQYRESDQIEGAKTTMYMTELWWFGNSFVFQLKNGHFIISDGGYRNDLAYLLDFLEEHAPNGEKPVVDAWIITHAHGDHCGALMTIVEFHREWMDRIFVEGIYVSEPNDEVLAKCGGHTPHAIVRLAAVWFKKQDGSSTGLYRPLTGQRYYFSDITMDIIYSQEQVMEENYTNLNEASTVCLFTIEGQKCFLSGDVHETGLEFIVKNYPKEYLELDFFTLNHHGFNTSQVFHEYAKVKTALITRIDRLPAQRIRETRYLMEQAEESLNWKDGTLVFEFPYEVGAYKCLPKNDWKYEEGAERPTAGGPIYSLWGNAYTGFIFDLDDILTDGEDIKDDAKRFLTFAAEKKVHLSAFSLQRTTEEIALLFKHKGIDTYFELILGKDSLGTENPYGQALQKSEDQFATNHHKMVVLCNAEEAILSNLEVGVKTAAIMNAEEMSEEMRTKAWKCFATCDELIEYFISRDIDYE